MGFSLSEICLTLLCIQDASHHKKWQFVQMVITYSLINTEDLCEELEIFVSIINFFFFFLWLGGLEKGRITMFIILMSKVCTTVSPSCDLA